jgi:hypothetical protein
MEIQKILTQLPQVANEWKTLPNGLISKEDLPIIELKNYDNCIVIYNKKDLNKQTAAEIQTC